MLSIFKLFLENTSDQRKNLVVNKLSFSPELDDCEKREIRVITPDKEIVKEATIVRDPDTGEQLIIDEPSVIIRRKKQI